MRTVEQIYWDWSFLNLLQEEIAKIDATHGSKFNSIHEGYAVLVEEVDEFWDEVKKKPDKRVDGEVLSELVQIAATAWKIAVSQGYVVK